MRALWLLLAAAVVVMLAGTPPSARARAGVEVIAGGLVAPWSIAFAPDGRIFLTERPGRIRVVRNGRLDPRPYLVIPGVVNQDEGGLLGLALHPDFARSRMLYVYYTYESGAGFGNRVVRLVDRPSGPAIDRVIVDGIPGWPYHDGGRIKFGPDGRLYVGTGYGPDEHLAQDLGSLGGKILRVNDDGTIPRDAPFPGSPVYSYGHRNVQGLAWHPATRRLYATEHGPTGEAGLYFRDEVNLVEPGANYGWPVVAGAAGDPRFAEPLITSGTEESWAPSGATFVSNGPWRNSLLFAALRGRHLHRVILDESGTRVVDDEKLFLWRFGRLRDVVEAPDGSLYVLTSNRDGRGLPADGDDRVLRITPPIEGRR